MSDGVIGAVIGMGGLTVVNVVAVAFFYGRLCGRVEGISWRVDRLWAKVFNGSSQEVKNESRRRQ